MKRNWNVMAVFGLKCFIVSFSFLVPFLNLQAESPSKDASDIFDIDLEGLMNIKVSSVNKKSQKMSDTAAAVYVITSDDIARSTANSIPELLRGVPGIQVAQMGPGKWAITSRGFNNEFGDKLLVMIDGRSVYTPLFGGVFWDVQDTMLEDIDRVEIIRGPGASVWGANAVNGVINIITKNSAKTQGNLFSGGTGTETPGFASIRHGGTLSDNSTYRIYSKYFNRDGSKIQRGGETTPEDSKNGYSGVQGGFRVDSTPTSSRALTLSGDAYYQDQQSKLSVPTLIPPYVESVERGASTAGGNILARWEERWSDDSDSELQVYFDRADRSSTIIDASIDTFDVDLQNRTKLDSVHEIVWGFDYRLVKDDIKAFFPLGMDPASRSTTLVSGFVQDEITLVNPSLKLTLGTKVEHNDYTGFEIQPTARLLWAPTDSQRVWGAVSRAVRTPARSDNDVSLGLNSIPGATPETTPIISFNGNRDFNSENLLALEVGYRYQPKSSLYFDLTAFYNSYSDIGTYETKGPQLTTQDGFSFLSLPSPRGNNARVDVFGFEALADWEPLEWWRVQATFSLLQIEKEITHGSADISIPPLERQNPENQFSLRSFIDLSDTVRFDSVLRFVEGLPDYSIDSYVDLDARLAFAISKDLEFSVNGVNLLHDRHTEFQGVPVLTESSGIERAVFGKLTVKF